VAIKRLFGENSVVNPIPEYVGIVEKATMTNQSFGVGLGLKQQHQPSSIFIDDMR